MLEVVGKPWRPLLVFCMNYYFWRPDWLTLLGWLTVRNPLCNDNPFREIVGGDVAQLVEHRTGTPLTKVRFPGAARNFSPRVNFQCRLSYSVRPLPCAIACIYICAHVKDLVVRVRIRWSMETLEHSSCTLGWVARPCRTWLSPGKAIRIFRGRNSIGTIQW